jgi:AraC-like DNA-binding protein
VPGTYLEHTPPARLAPYVECFWTLEAPEDMADYPVLPDGCVDIVYSRGRAGDEPQVVGAMTRARKFALSAGQFDCGVRFRPGMSAVFLRVPGTETTDRSIPIGDLGGARGRQLRTQWAEANSPEHCIRLLEQLLNHPAKPGVVQQACASIVENGGLVRVDQLAFDAGLSGRQLRRLFLEQTGLTPKHLSRVIRFRHSVSLLRRSRRGDFAQVALECGYYDQAHFINEFRELSGYSPGEFSTLPR